MALNMLMYPCHRANECNWPACRPDCDGAPADRNNGYWVRAEYSNTWQGAHMALVLSGRGHRT